MTQRWLAIVFLLATLTSAQCHSILLSLRTALHDPSHTLQDWDITTNHSCCSWSGVECDPSANRVTELDLSDRNLSGAFPDDLSAIPTLTRLNISRNRFSGCFPSIFFSLKELRILDVSRNSFGCNFPTGIAGVSFLTVFDGYSNSFTGRLPKEVSQLKYLERLNLGGSFFEGEIPKEYGYLSKVQELYLAGNELNGSIPPEFRFLQELRRLELGYNLNISGTVPSEIGYLRKLEYLDISECSITGGLPAEIVNVTSLRVLLLFSNGITGTIPSTFSELRSLEILDLSDNELSGGIPEAIASLKQMKRLSLMENRLSGEIPAGIAGLSELEIFSVWDNSLTGKIPPLLGSNTKLQWLDVSSNSLNGSIPERLCDGMKLYKLILFSNDLEGNIDSLANCRSLVRLRIQNNVFSGQIHKGFSFLPNLTFVDFSNNEFSGEIPNFGQSPMIQYLNISRNSFESVLPNGIWKAPMLQIFSASSAKLIGGIPKFEGCESVYKLEMGSNELNGSIPWEIENCEKLIELNLSGNSLSGIIPWEISALPSITSVDLSHNLISGSIPSGFANCTTLEVFDVSFNRLYQSAPPVEEQGKKGIKVGEIAWVSAAAIGLILFIGVIGVRCLLLEREEEEGIGKGKKPGEWKMTAFQRLGFSAEDVAECVSLTKKEIGKGSGGKVYKAEMPGGESIAVKKLRGLNKQFMREVEMMGNVRHRNIVKLLGCCSNRESTMLLYEYMPNGNLEDLLHEPEKWGIVAVDWITRCRIALGVAQGISYLHNDCKPPIVHRDLKPSNILLDAQMEARIADFGVAKWIGTNESMSAIAGSYGYIAPEYLYTLRVDEKSDIYSYGVVLMEIVIGRRCVEMEFGEGKNIVDWVRANGEERIVERIGENEVAAVKEEMKQMLRIAGVCSSRDPADRPSMRDVVQMVQEAMPKWKKTVKSSAL